MKLQKVKIEGFGLFNDSKEFNFSDDRINIVFGNNETGKSTLLKSIIAALFGLDKSRWALLKPLQPAEKFSTEIHFTENGTEYKLLRDYDTNNVHFRKKNKDNSVETLFLGPASPQSRTEAKEFYYAALKKVIGVNNEEIFKNINVIYQKSMESQVDKEIQQILTGTVGTNYKNISEQWAEEYFNLTKKSAWDDFRDRKNNRDIELLGKELADLEEKKEKILELHIKSSQTMENLKTYEAQLRTLEEEVKKSKNEYELTKLYLDKLKEKNNYEDKLHYFSQDIEKYDKLKAELDTKKGLIENKYPDFKNFTDDDLDLIKETALLEKELKEKNAELETHANVKDVSFIKKILLGINGMIIAGMAFAVRLLYNNPISLYVGILLGSAAFIFLIRTIVIKYKSNIQNRTQISLMKNNISELNKKLSILNKKIQHLSLLKNKPDLQEQFNEYKQVRQDLNNLNYAMEQMKNPQESKIKNDELKKSLFSVNIELEQLEKDNPGLVVIKENKEKTVSYIQNLKETSEKKEIMIEELKNQVYSINKELTSIPMETESLAAIRYRIEEVEDDLRRYKDSAEAYILAINTLNDVILEYQEKHIDRLSKSISFYYNEITEEKHKIVSLSEDFEPRVQEGETVDLKNLSCGAEDQLYFAVRLALLKELNELTALPLFLDDPFVNFDKPRLEIVKKILYSLCEKNQIVLFTHIKSYSDWDNINLISL